MEDDGYQLDYRAKEERRSSEGEPVVSERPICLPCRGGGSNRPVVIVSELAKSFNGHI